MKIVKGILITALLLGAVLFTVALVLHAEYERDYKPYLEQYLDE